MEEMTRVGLPNLVAQSEQMARTRGAHVGAERAAQAGIAVQLRAEADQRAEELEPPGRVEALGRGRGDGGESGREAPDERDAPPSEAPWTPPADDAAPGLRLDVRA